MRLKLIAIYEKITQTFQIHVTTIKPLILLQLFNNLRSLVISLIDSINKNSLSNKFLFLN